MRNEERLKQLLDKREFRSFWNCYDFLINASYSPMEAFSISLSRFGEEGLFTNVAFIRVNECPPFIDRERLMTFPRVVVGVITKENVHLTAMYNAYQKWMMSGRVSVQNDVEETCEIINVVNITSFIKEFVFSCAHKHYGIEAKIIKLEPDHDPDRTPQILNINENEQGVLRRLNGQDNIHRMYLPPETPNRA